MMVLKKITFQCLRDWGIPPRQLNKKRFVVVVVVVSGSISGGGGCASCLLVQG